MQISKLTHEKLLAALHHAETAARAWREAAQKWKVEAQLHADDLKKARAEADGRAKFCEEMKRHNAELQNAVFVRETAIVQVSLRLAAYGDPGLSLAVTP